MLNWLNKLKQDLENLDLETIPKPWAEIKPEDYVVGEANDELKRLYGFALMWENTADETKIVARNARDQQSHDYYSYESHKAFKRYEVLIEMFWISLKDTFDLWHKPSVGIRKGWKVTWSEEETPETPTVSINYNVTGPVH